MTMSVMRIVDRTERWFEPSATAREAVDDV
jgi:hypothetical protein